MWSETVEVLNPYKAICVERIREREVKEQKAKVKDFWTSLFGMFGIR